MDSEGRSGGLPGDERWGGRVFVRAGGHMNQRSDGRVGEWICRWVDRTMSK